MYLSKSKLLFSQIVSWVTVLWTAFGVFLGITGIGLCISAMNGNYTVIREDEIESHFAAYIAFVIVPGAFLIWAVKNLGLTGKAYKFNTLFEGDPDGVISVEKIAVLFGMPVHKFVTVFDKLLKKGYITNCTLENPDNPMIVLNNGAKTVEGKFDIAQCPSCGASNNIKLGFVESCKFCGAKLTEDNTENL